MFFKKKLYVILYVSFFIGMLTSCRLHNISYLPDGGQPGAGSFEVGRDRKTLFVQGQISSSSLNDFNLLYALYPDITIVVIRECGGSSDDGVNLQLMQRIYTLGLDTYLVDYGMIASGGVDLFLSGRTHTMGKNVSIGVHAWAGDDDEATDYPDNHPAHQPYIDTYIDIGMTAQEARDFYFFTIGAAPARGMHWMTESEIEKYKLIRR